MLDNQRHFVGWMIDRNALNGGLFLQVDTVSYHIRNSGKSSVALKLEHSRNEASGKDLNGCKEDIDRLIDRSTVGDGINTKYQVLDFRRCMMIDDARRNGGTNGSCIKVRYN